MRLTALTTPSLVKKATSRSRTSSKGALLAERLSLCVASIGLMQCLYTFTLTSIAERRPSARLWKARTESVIIKPGKTNI